MKFGNQGTGYYQAHFEVGSTRVSWLVHRLVATVFVPNPEGLPEVNHINGVKSDCRAVNLEWATRLANVRHAIDTGLTDLAVCKKAVEGVSLDGLDELRFASMKEAEVSLSPTGRNGGNISLNIKGKTKHAYGYVWRLTP